MTVYSDAFEPDRDGYLDERADAPSKRMWVRAVSELTSSIFVDPIRPEGIVRIELK